MSICHNHGNLKIRIITINDMAAVFHFGKDFLYVEISPRM